ncbi:MAG: hypothetical protein Q7R54_01075 [bacterium]|nr:hypothetical protein [bacterium]
MKSNRRRGFYHYCCTIPDRVYPFKTRLQGRWVRGTRSYNARVKAYEREYGQGHLGYYLGTYRQLFHFVGSLVFLICTAYISSSFLGSTYALYTLLLVAIVLISYQEFYLHRRMYHQLWKKSIIDWAVWVIPVGVFLFTNVR